MHLRARTVKRTWGAEAGPAAGFADPLLHTYDEHRPYGPVCYCHGERGDEPRLVPEKDAAGCGVEYAYLHGQASQCRMFSSGLKRVPL